MGRFADGLVRRQALARAQRQAERAAKKVRWPAGFEGALMWCPLCYREIHRIPEGTECPSAEQQRLVDAHRSECRRWKMRAVR